LASDCPAGPEVPLVRRSPSAPSPLISSEPSNDSFQLSPASSLDWGHSVVHAPRRPSASSPLISREPSKDSFRLSPASSLERGHSVVHAPQELCAPPAAPMNLEAKEVQPQDFLAQSTGDADDPTSHSPHFPNADPAVADAPHAEVVKGGNDHDAGVADVDQDAVVGHDAGAADVDQDAVVGAPEKEDKGVHLVTPPEQGVDTNAGRKAVKTPRLRDGNSGGVGGGAKKGEKDDGADVAKGEWVCTECSNVNWSFRIMCNRCRAPPRGQHAGSPQESAAARGTPHHAATPARGTPHSAATPARGTPHSFSKGGGSVLTPFSSSVIPRDHRRYVANERTPVCLLIRYDANIHHVTSGGFYE
jgi:hypothetical protein